MASWIGRFSAVAILAWICSTPAQATTYASATCLQVVITGNGVADCLQGQYSGSAPGIEVGGFGEAHADLHTGVLRSRSSAAGERSGTNPADAQGALGNSIAKFADTITIGGGYSGDVQIRMEVSGGFLASVPYGSYGSATGGTTTDPTVTPQLFLWDNDPSTLDSDAGVFVRQYTGQFLLYVDHASAQGSGTFSTNADSRGQFADPADVRIVLTTTFTVTPSNPTFSFEARLGTATGISALALSPGDTRVSEVDFGNSAHLSLILPAGVPWTSESGVFLQGVPEPSIGALLAGGMLCLSAASLVRRARANTGTRSPQA